MPLRGAVMAMMLGTGAVAADYKGYEMPPFAVVAEADGYEVRDYDPHLLALVRYRGSVGQTVQSGFRTLAGYIFGGNASGQKIAMTVPVTQMPADGGYDIAFMMPARYDQESLPAPNVAEIRFEETPAERVAVRQFSGWARAATLDAQAAALRSDLEADGQTILDGPRYAYYDDPFTLPWRRRNEVMFVVE